MSLRINHNIASLDGHRQLLANSTAVSKSLEKLSSGLRINHAADDAAGLVISEQMRSQITGLDQAVSNSETAVSMVQTAEGALDEINSLLKQVRQLALHAANEGANDVNQLVADQKEVDNAVASVTRIAQQTQFGTKKLLDGTLAGANTYDTSRILKFDVGSSLLARTDYHAGQVSLVIDSSAETATVAWGNSFNVASAVSTTGAADVSFSAGNGASAANILSNAFGGVSYTSFIMAAFGATTNLASFFTTATNSVGMGVFAMASFTGTSVSMIAQVSATGALNVRVGDTSFTFADGVTVTSILNVINSGQSVYTVSNTATAASGGLFITERTTGAIGAAKDLAVTATASATFSMSVTGATNGTQATTLAASTTMITGAASYGLNDATTIKTVQSSGFSNITWGSVNDTGAAFTQVDGTSGTGTTFASALGVGTNRLVTGAQLTVSVAGKDYTFANGETLADIVSNINNAQTDYTVATDRDYGLTMVRNKIGSGGAATDLGVRVQTADGTTMTMDPISSTAAQFTGGSAAAGGVDFGVNIAAHLAGANLPGGRINLTTTGADASDLTNTGDGISIKVSSAFAKQAQSTTANMTRGALFQVGPNNGQKVGIDIKNVVAGSLGLGGDTTGVLTSLQSLIDKQSLVNGYQSQSVAVIDKAIDDVTNLRGQLGGFQSNTLESGLNSLRVTHENLTAAESSIRDVDFAGESANFTKNQILVQASTAMLAQANQLPQNVLKLLG